MKRLVSFMVSTLSGKTEFTRSLESTQDPDWELIRRFETGDTSAFTALFAKYQTRIINLAFRFTRQRESAEDVAQEVFLKVYEHKVHLEERAKFSTWLYRVTVNAALDVLRKRKWLLRSLEETITPEATETLGETLVDPNATSPQELLQRQELQQRVQQAVHRLPEKLRTPLMLYQFEALPYAEIAQILGLTEKTVEKRLYRARELLRKVLPVLS